MLIFRSVATVIGSRPREGHKTNSKSFELVLLLRESAQTQGSSRYSSVNQQACGSSKVVTNL